MDSGKASVVVIKNELEEYYRLLHCNYVENYRVTIGNKTFDIICDDEARLKKNTYPSVVSENTKIILRNNVLICNRGKNSFTSLNDEDIELIKEQIRKAWTVNGNGYEKRIKGIEVLSLDV